jgi:CRISPR-associated endonuclease/helicase Cas3
MTTLLGKSARGSRRLTLIQHLVDTANAATHVFRPGSRQTAAFLRFFGVPPSEHARFLLHLQVAGLFHDVGKANDDFQAVVQHKQVEQSLRHEHLSALLLCLPEMRAWLSSGGLDVDAITAAVLSHHLKASGEPGDWLVLQPRRKAPTRLFFDDEQLRDALGRVQTLAGLSAWPSIPSAAYADAAWDPAHEALFRNAAHFKREQTRSPQRWRLMLAMKAGLIVTDSVASGLWREQHEQEQWLDDVLHRPTLTAAQIHDDVIQKRQVELGARWTGWHSFQEGAATVGRRGLLLAACGAGKTLAAWRWAQSVAANEAIGRVIFLYPTRGTATEGFRDYVAHAPEGEAALVHGTSSYELQSMLENPPESLRGKSLGDEATDRLFSLGLWDKRYFSATVDQFLGFIENNYGGLCLLPALADAAVVFDEVHSYDPRMWNALVTFLQRFDVPVLCMTATLPPARRRALTEACNLTAYPQATDMEQLHDLDEKESYPRYRIEASSRAEAFAVAVDAVAAGRRVLWVVNTVRRCQELAVELQKHIQATVGVYHSRFKLIDRQERHRETVDAFRASSGEPRAAIAVTTQVCEMSLDLDADVLITEHAPISSLVQRFGRCHRRLRDDPTFRGRLLTYPPEKAAPYDKTELTAAAAFLSALGDGDVSQRALALALEEHAPVERDASGHTAFVNSGYFAVSGALRDSDDVGAAAVLSTDVERYLAFKDDGSPEHAGLLLTVPKQAHPTVDERLPSFLKVADAARYSAWLGFVVDDQRLNALKEAP